MIFKRLLITRHDKIGDFVLILPLCQAIKKKYPETYLAVLVSRVNFEFARKLSFIDQVILYEKNALKTVREIEKQKFEASISCYITWQIGIILWASGIRKRFSPATKLAQFFFNFRIEQRRSRAEKTEWQYNLALGRCALKDEGLSFEPPLLKFHQVTTSLQRVVFHPGHGGSSDGNLRLTDYVRLARRISRFAGVEVVFTFGPDDKNTYSEVRKLIDFKAELLQSKMSLFEFCRYLSESALLISTSTGPMHLAGAVDTPTISFFGDTLFAGSKRWSTVSHPDKQRNFQVSENYPANLIEEIENSIVEVLTANNPNTHGTQFLQEQHESPL